MSDAPFEKRTNSYVIYRSNGKVLVAGLGIGLILFPMNDKPEVKEITVIEKSKDVIDLVWPFIKEKLPKVKVINADIFEWSRPKAKWDIIYFDIWPDICGDNYNDMKRLHQKFKHNLNRANPNCLMESWERETCKERE